MKKLLKTFKCIAIAGTVFMTGFSMNSLNTGAVGIYVDEDATGDAADGLNSTEEGSAQTGSEEGQSTEDRTGGTAEESQTSQEDESITPVPGADPAALWLAEIGSGEKDMYEAMVERQISLAADSDSTASVLDISKGNIVLSEGGAYIQDGTGGKQEGTISSEEFTIGGTTGSYNITVEAGAKPTIQVNGMSINPKTEEEVSGKRSGLYIKTGAKVTLVLGENTTVLKGCKSFQGIALEPGATLRIQGKGMLTVLGGAGANGISHSNNSKGGSLWIGEEAELRSYSDQISGACKADVSVVSKKILQGTMYNTVAADPSVLIKVENRDNPEENYPVNLPINYRSFAASTTFQGGAYVSYYPGADGKIQDSQLLVNDKVPARHNYSLEGTGNTFASLEDLVSRKVEYNLTFNANGGTFAETAKDRKPITVGYGETIALPSDSEVTRKDYSLRDWYRIMDSVLDEDKWNVLTDRVVKDNMILYATWKPNKCTVRFRTDNTYVKQLDNRDYESTISYDDSWKPGTDYKPGYTLVYWTGPDGKKWEFGSNGTKLIKKTTTLDAVWLADCTVTFDANAGDETLEGWPVVEKTQATSRINSPERKLERKGFSFTGKWYTDKNCTKEWNFEEDTVTKNITLYAGWGADITKVSFLVDLDEGETVTPPDISVKYGEPIEQPLATKAPRKERPTAYTLEGWYTEDGEKWDFSKGLSDSDGILKLKPKWKQTVYWVVLHPGDKSAIPQEDLEKDVPNGSSLKSQYGEGLNQFYTKTGYKITGWKTKTGKTWDVETVLTEDLTTSAKALTAMWEPETYTMTFVTPEGAPPMPEGEGTRNVVYNKTTEAPKYGTKDTAWEGHTFHGWYTDEDPEKGRQWKFQGETGADVMKAENVTLYAIWTEDEYRVSFHTFTGDLEENKIPDQYPLSYGDQVAEPEKPIRSHYDFLGWYKDKEVRNLWDFTEDKVTGDMMLYAGWAAHPIDVKLHVRYEAENKQHPGEVVDIPYTGEVFYGDYLDQAALESLEQTTARPGYTLNGWYTDENYTEEGRWDFPNSKVQPETEKIDLYAYWTWDEYTVNFQTWEGDSQVPPVTGVHYGETISKPSPEPKRTHYTFDNWYADIEAEDKKPWDFEKDVVNGNMSLYAGWIPNTYTLSFETNGGTKLEPVDVVYGEHVSADYLQTTKAGYSLTGWFKDSGLTEPFIPETDLIDGNMKIYAGWELEKYSVTYHFRESEDSPEEETITYKDVYHVGDYLTKPDKVIPHKTLSTWYKAPTWSKEDQWLFKRDKVEGDTELYAYWSDTMYNVHFDTSGGTEIEDTKLAWGSQLEQPKDPVHPGGTFAGWYKDKEYQTAWNFEEDFVEGDTVVYAKWNLTMCTVTFETDEGLPIPDIQVLPYGSMLTEPTAPEKEGFTFAGWKANGAKENWDFANGVIEGDMILMAQWVEAGKEPEPPVEPGDPDDPQNPQDPEDPQDPQNPEDPANPAAQQSNNGGSGSGSGTTGGTGTNNGSGTNSGTDANGSTAKQALSDAASELKKILTGDKAPVTYLVTGIFLSAAVIIGILRKKYRRK